MGKEGRQLAQRANEEGGSEGREVAPWARVRNAVLTGARSGRGRRAGPARQPAPPAGGWLPVPSARLVTCGSLSSASRRGRTAVLPAHRARLPRARPSLAGSAVAVLGTDLARRDPSRGLGKEHALVSSGARPWEPGVRPPVRFLSLQGDVQTQGRFPSLSKNGPWGARAPGPAPLEPGGPLRARPPGSR